MNILDKLTFFVIVFFIFLKYKLFLFIIFSISFKLKLYNIIAIIILRNKSLLVLIFYELNSIFFI